MQQVQVYGTSWSVASWDVRRLLEAIEEPYEFIDLEQDGTALVWAMRECQGDLASALPIIRFRDGTLLMGATRQLVAHAYGVRLDTGVFKRMSEEGGVPSKEDTAAV